MTPEKIVFARPFCLHRHHDVSGVSGDGIVAHGVEFPDGTVALRWVGSNPTSVVFHDNGIESVEAIHGHGGNTEVVWVAGVQMSRAVKAEAEALRRRYRADEPFTIVTPHRDGIAMHNRRKAAHREKHEWGQLRSPSFEKETTS